MEIEESMAWGVWQAVPTLDEERKRKAARILSDYRAQQEARGLPLWPAREAERFKLRERASAAVLNPLALDAENGAYSHADRLSPGLGDKLRKRDAAIAWTATEYDVPEQEVRDHWPLYKADLGRKWGAGPLDDLAFFDRIKADVETDRKRLENAASDIKAAEEAALRGDGVVSALQAWQQQAGKDRLADSTRFTQAFLAVDGALAPHRAIIKAAPEAMRRSQRGEATEADRETLERLARTVTDAQGRDRAVMMRALALGVRQVAEAGGQRGVVGTFTAASERLVEDMFGGIESLLEVSPERMAFKGAIDTPEVAQRAVAEEIRLRTSERQQGALAVETAGLIPETERRELTPEEVALVREQIDRRRKLIQTGRELKRLAREADPLRDDVWGVMASGTASTLTLALPLAMGGPGVFMAATGYAKMETEELLTDHPDMNPADALKIGALSGAIQAGLDKLQLFGLGKFSPNLRKLLTGQGSKELVKRAIGETAAVLTYENTVEGLQDITTPTVQAIFSDLQANVPGVNWGEEWKRWKDSRADVFIGMLPLILLGTGANTIRNRSHVKQILEQDTDLARAGVLEDDRASIAGALQEGKVEEAQAIMQDAWGRRSPELAAEMGNEKEAELIRFANVLQEAERAGMIPTIRRGAQGWTVEQDGVAVPVSTREEAVAMAYASLDEMERKAAEATAQLADEFMQMGGGRAEAFEISRQGATVQSEVEAGRTTPEQARRAVELYGQMHGLTAEEASAESLAVLGNNRMEQVEGVRTAVSRIFGGGNLLTALHEGVHGRWNAGLESGHYSHAMGVSWVRMAEQASGWQFLPTRDDAAVTPAMLDEAIVEVAQANLLGQRKDGKQHFTPGLISRGVASFALAGRAQAKEAGKLATFLKAWREFWGQVLRAGRAMAKARREGKLGDDFDVLLDDLLGTEPQQRFEAQAAREAADMAAEIDPDNMPFSLAPGVLGERIERAATAEPLQVDDVDSWRGISPTERGEKARQIARGLQAEGSIFNADRNKEIHVSIDGVKHWARFSADPRKASLLGHLRQLFERAVYLRSEKPDARYEKDRSSVKAFHRFALPVLFGNEESIAYLTVKENANGRWIYDGRLPNENALDDGKPGSAPGTGADITGGRQAHVDFLKQRLEVNQELTTEDRFSLAPRNLVTVHNLSADNLRHAIKVGGLAVPSLGIIRSDLSRFGSFGEITLVARPELVDPQVNRDSKVFNADVYSPRYPYVRLVFKQSQADKIGPLFKPAFAELEQVQDKGWSWTVGNLVEEVIDRGFSNIGNNYLAQFAFARENGLIEKPAEPVDAWEFGNNQLRNAVAERSDEIATWVRSKVDAAGITYEEKIADGTTSSGKRRFLPHNLDTVVRIMTRKLKDGEGFNYGVPSIRAANAKPFKSLKAIQDARDKIIPSEAMEALKKEVNEEFVALAERALAVRETKPRFGSLDAFSDDLKALVQGDIRWVRQMYGDSSVVDEMREFVGKLRDMPTEYFEAKVRRAVELLEFEAAVVPDTLPDDLQTALRKRGLSVVTYSKGDAESRAAAVRAVADEVGASFSLAPRSLASVADTVLASQMRKPEFREKYLELARQRLDKLRQDGEWRVSKWGQASQRVGTDTLAGRIRTPSNIEAERKFRQRSRQRELLDEGMAKLTPETLAAYEQGLTTIEDDPLVSTMLGLGKLMSKTEAKKAGKLTTDGKGNAGDYDGAPWLPPSWYGGGSRGYMPDRMAQELHEAGLLKDAYPDTLWEALRSAIGSARAQNEAVRKAQAAVRAIEKNAAEQSRAEAEAWAKEERAKVPSAKDRQMAALRTLDVILSAFPPVVRGRVGGFVKLASLGSDAAREAEILRRLEKLDEVVEDEARKHYAERIDKLFERAKPKKEAGKKPQGKLGPDAQRLVDLALGFSKLTAAEVTAERAAIAARMENATGPEVVDLLEREHLLDLFGALDERTAAELETAHDWLADTYQAGRNRWRAVVEARALEVEERREEARKDIGKLGLDSEQQDELARAKKMASRAKGMAFSWLSFEQVVQSALGRASKLGRELVREARAATNAKTDAMREKRLAFRDAMAGIFGTTRQREWQEKLWELSQIGGARAVSVLKMEGARVEERTVPVEIVERIIAGEAIAKSYGLDALTVDILEAAWAANEALPANRRKASLSYSVPVAGKPTPTRLSQLQAVHVTMLARQSDYAENMAGHGWTADVLKEIEAQLSDEVKGIRAWLADQYRGGYDSLNAVYSRMYGVNLPRLVNYAPGTFEARDMMGAEIDPYGQGLLSEGGFRAGMVKTRAQHRARPRLEDALAVYWGHVNATEHFKAFAEFARDLRGVLNEASVRASIKAKGGATLLEAAQKWVEAFERNGLEARSASKAWDEFLRKRQSSQAFLALAYNLGTLMKQSTAALGTLLNMGPTAGARQFGRLLTGQLELGASYRSAVIQRRLDAGYSPEVRQAMAAMMADRPTWASAFLQRGMETIGLVDAVFTTASHAMAWDYHFREAKAGGLTDAQARQVADLEAEATVARTAQPSEMMDRSLGELGMAPMARFLFMFATEARQKAAIALEAYSPSSGLSKGERATRLLLLHVVFPLAIQTVSNLWRDARDDDDDELFDEDNWRGGDYLKAMLLGPVLGLPLIGGALNAALTPVFGGHYFANDPTQPLNKAATGAGDIFEAIEEGDLETGLKGARSLLWALALAMGGERSAALGTWANVLYDAFRVGDNAIGEADD